MLLRCYWTYHKSGPLTTVPKWELTAQQGLQKNKKRNWNKWPWEARKLSSYKGGWLGTEGQAMANSNKKTASTSFISQPTEKKKIYFTTKGYLTSNMCV